MKKSKLVKGMLIAGIRHADIREAIKLRYRVAANVPMNTGAFLSFKHSPPRGKVMDRYMRKRVIPKTYWHGIYVHPGSQYNLEAALAPTGSYDSLSKFCGDEHEENAAV